MVICLDKDTSSCRTCRRKIDIVFWVIWIELGFSGVFCDVALSCIIYTRNPGLPMRDRFFEKFRKSKYRSKFLIWFLGITHQRVSLEKLWALRKNWSCPEILDGYRKSLLIRRQNLFPCPAANVVFRARKKDWNIIFKVAETVSMERLCTELLICSQFDSSLLSLQSHFKTAPYQQKKIQICKPGNKLVWI